VSQSWPKQTRGECAKNVKIHSESSLDSYYNDLLLLDVRESRASRIEDKDSILSKIGDIEAFNARVQWLIFGAEGLFKGWVDNRDGAASIGKLAQRAMSRKRSRNNSTSSGNTMRAIGTGKTVGMKRNITEEL